jgi:hypothetical protein
MTDPITRTEDCIILDLCGGTGAWSQPYKDAGYDVRVITLPEYDVTKFKPTDEDVYGILAAPPCTMFSMARTTAKTPRDFAQGLETVHACLNIIWFYRIRGSLKFWALENPTAYLRQFLGKPPMTFHPYEFGDRYKKRTDLWGYYNEPCKKPVVLTEKEIKDSRVNTRPLPKIPGLTVADRRAITPPGFARAFYEANK